MTNENYFDNLIIQFPLLKEIILEEDAEMIHYRMERFADYTIEQIKTNNITELKNCFAFQESKIDLMTSDLRNALVVSYCEALLLGENADKMKSLINLMPLKLKDIYIDYEKWYNDLADKNIR
jgi:hypothetical protein